MKKNSHQIGNNIIEIEIEVSAPINNNLDSILRDISISNERAITKLPLKDNIISIIDNEKIEAPTNISNDLSLRRYGLDNILNRR